MQFDERGYIGVNDRLQTSAVDVWAIGEVAGSPQFTHVSVDDFRIVRDNMAGAYRSTGDRLIPYTLFTDPPLARVGLNETEAMRLGLAVRIATLPMSNVLRTEATDETQGFMKVLVGADDDRILGFTMIGSEAGEVLAAMQTAMIAGLRSLVFRFLEAASRQCLLPTDCGSSKMFARITSIGLVTAVLTNCQQICRAPLLGTLPGVSRRTELFAPSLASGSVQPRSISRLSSTCIR
ncbi:hypothetical protein ACW91P_11970 [Paraburkholderia strydomiana]